MFTRVVILCLFLCCMGAAQAQDFYLKITSQAEKEQKTIDSLAYKTTHINPKAVVDEVNIFSEKLTKIGYLSSKVIAQQKANDSTFVFEFSLGQKIDFIQINTQKATFLRENSLIEKDTVILPFSETENFMNLLLHNLEVHGFSTSGVKLTNFSTEKNILRADLTENITAARHLDDIVVLGYKLFPKGHKKQLKKRYRKKVFNKQILSELYDDVQKFVFVNQIKAPEILFTTDSTKVFLYLEKARANNFDGFVGFSTDESEKMIFMGYADLMLNNLLNSGEQFKLYWKSDGKEQQTFDFLTELPYLFQTPFALRANLNIFKQDSTFQNTRTNIELGYYFNYNTRAYLGYSSTESNDIQNTNSLSMNDFENTFYTLSLEYFYPNRTDFLFPEKIRANIKSGTGKRVSAFDDNQQFFVSAEAFNNFYLNPKNIINLKVQGYYLDSDSYIISELYRFGGINSLRGFTENSLQANLFTGLMAEYRYVLAPSLYVHSITDFGYFQDKASGFNNQLLGLGFGLGLYTNGGLFNLVYANGSIDGQEIKLSNSIVHISFKARF
ncbi:MAG: hypothetical protein WCY89_07070 [Flavobacteriaceae bacterium]